jgi:membrane-associated phospholipid phosphatase
MNWRGSLVVCRVASGGLDLAGADRLAYISPMMLPEPRSGRALAAAAVATVLVCAAMYYVPQHWPLREAAFLPLTALDRAVPFWPLSGLVYFSVFPFLLVSFLALRDRERAARFLYASLLAQTVGMLCFLLWPTAFPRDRFPVPADAAALGLALVRFCRSLDAPVNCLPSLHVSAITLCVAALRGTRWFRPALVAGMLLAASTLTFKQHYVIDVLAGFALGASSWVVLEPVERRTGNRLQDLP